MPGEEVAEALALVDEARFLSQQQFSLPLGGVTDLRTAVGHAEKGGILEPRQLIDAAQLLFAFARTREALDEPEADRMAWIYWGPQWNGMKVLNAGSLRELLLGKAP